MLVYVSYYVQTVVARNFATLKLGWVPHVPVAEHRTVQYGAKYVAAPFTVTWNAKHGIVMRMHPYAT